MMLVMVISMGIAFAWNSYPIIKTTAHFVLDPTIGNLLDFNLFWGMTLVVFLITLLTTIIQKYGTDQESLKQIKDEQKLLQEEMKKHRDNPEKLREINKKSLEFFPKTMDLTMKPLIYTAVPFVLFFRWFNDYFINSSYKFLGFMSWFWFYFVASIIFSSILRKVLKVH